MILFSLFLIMAHIKKMQRVQDIPYLDVWIPLQTTDNLTLTTISGYALTHDMALQSAELLRRYIKGELLGITDDSTTGYRWFQNSTTSGYFCEHDGLVSFVQSTQKNKDRLTLNRTLTSFRDKYKCIKQWEDPKTTGIQTEATLDELRALIANAGLNFANREKMLQDLANQLQVSNKLTIRALLQADLELDWLKRRITKYEELCSLYDFVVPAVPHTHCYHPNVLFPHDSRAFLYNGVYLVFDKHSPPNGPVLFRPHAWLAYKDGFTENQYNNTTPEEHCKKWPEITTTVQWFNREQTYRTDNFILHGLNPIQISTTSPIIGPQEDLIHNGPFSTEISSPEKYRVKTVHIILSDTQEIPENQEELLEYFKKLELSLHQQKFLIQLFFPFLQF